MSDSRFLKVENAPGLVRDVYSRAVINNNVAALEAAKKKKEAAKLKQNRINTLEKEVETLKSIVSQLVEKLNVDNSN